MLDLCLFSAQSTMVPTFHLREFRFPQDYESVFSLWQNAGEGIHVARSDMPDEIEKKLARDPDLFLVAENESGIIGTIIGGFDGRRGMMYHLAVSSHYQQKGVASALVTELETRLKDKGCMRMYLMVYPENKTAIDFYEKRDYKKMNVDVYGKDLL